MAWTNYVDVDGDTVTIEQANDLTRKSWWGGFRSGMTLAVALVVIVWVTWLMVCQ